MGCRVSSWTLFLHLIILLFAHNSEAREMSVDHRGHHHATNMPSDIPATYFYKINDMKLGKRMELYVAKKPTSSARLLPREQADSIPFSSQHLPYLLKLFSFPRGSREALTVEDTLRQCEASPNKLEAKTCATSLESMLDFVRDTFGITDPDSDEHPSLLTSTLISKDDENSVYQNYTALKEPEEVLAAKMIACHVVPYPYVVFFCHTQKLGDKVYKIPFVADNGDELDAFSVCHIHTSKWDPEFALFGKLGAEPGNPVCHVFPPHVNYIWVYTPKASI